MAWLQDTCVTWWQHVPCACVTHVNCVHMALCVGDTFLFWLTEESLTLSCQAETPV